MSEEKVNFDIYIDNLEEEINEKLENYFSENKNVLISNENLEYFLKAIGWLENFETESDKILITEILQKYEKEGKVDSEGIKKGINDFFDMLKNTEEDSDNNNVKRKKSEYGILLTKLSRISLKNEGINEKESMLIKRKENAIDEYDCLDKESLIQFRRIFLLLNINENEKNIIPIERIEQVINDHTFFTIDKDDIIKYIHFLSLDDTPLDKINFINIDNTIYSEIDSLIKKKLMNESINIYQISEEEEKLKVNNNDENSFDILQNILIEMKDFENNCLGVENTQSSLIKSYQKNTEEQIKDIRGIFGENQKIEEIFQNFEYTMKRMENCNDFLSKFRYSHNLNIKNIIECLKNNVSSLHKEIYELKSNYNSLCEEYEIKSKQELENFKEIEMLYNQINILEEELQSKKQKINELTDDKTEKDKEINDLNNRIESLVDNNEELKKQITELNIKVNKIKSEYDDLLNIAVKRVEEKEKKASEIIKERAENQLKNKEDKDGNKSKNEKLDLDALKAIDSMQISLAEKILKKKNILSQSNFEKLMEYTLQLEQLNINLKTEREKKEQKIKELEEKSNQSTQIIAGNKKEIGILNIEIKNLQNSLTNLKGEIKAKETIHTSIRINNQTHLTRLSKLKSQRLNPLKFKKFLIDADKGKNNKKYGFSVSGKNIIKKRISMPQNINNKLAKKQKNNSNDLLSQNINNIVNIKVKEKENRIIEEQNKIEEEADQKIKIDSSKNKLNNNSINIIINNNIEISKNSELNTKGLKSSNKIIHSSNQNKVFAVMIYEISSRQSFEIVTSYIENIKNSTPKTVLIVLIGNKCYLEKNREVTEEEGSKFADKNGILFFETSVKIDENVDEFLKHSAALISQKINKNYYDSKNISSFEKTKFEKNFELGMTLKKENKQKGCGWGCCS